MPSFRRNTTRAPLEPNRQAQKHKYITSAPGHCRASPERAVLPRGMGLDERELPKQPQGSRPPPPVKRGDGARIGRTELRFRRVTSGAVDRGARVSTPATIVRMVRSNNEEAIPDAPPSSPRRTAWAATDARRGCISRSDPAPSRRRKATHNDWGGRGPVGEPLVHAGGRGPNPDLSDMGTTITAMMTTATTRRRSPRRRLQGLPAARGEAPEGLTQDHTVVDRLAREGKIPARRSTALPSDR